MPYSRSHGDRIQLRLSRGQYTEAGSRQRAGLDGTAPDRGRDYIFATDNARDFVRLYRRIPVHNGLILIMPKVDREEQKRLFEIALRYIDTLPDLVNKCLSIDESGSVEVSDLHA